MIFSFVLEGKILLYEGGILGAQRKKYKSLSPSKSSNNPDQMLSTKNTKMCLPGTNLITTFSLLGTNLSNKTCLSGT